MLSSGDLGSIANLIGNPEQDHSDYAGRVEEVDVNHLDYSFISSCKDKNEIISLLNHLK
jgi:hypothetical protein